MALPPPQKPSWMSDADWQRLRSTSEFNRQRTAYERAMSVGETSAAQSSLEKMITAIQVTKPSGMSETEWLIQKAMARALLTGIGVSETELLAFTLAHGVALRSEDEAIAKYVRDTNSAIAGLQAAIAVLTVGAAVSATTLAANLLTSMSTDINAAVGGAFALEKASAAAAAGAGAATAGAASAADTAADTIASTAVASAITGLGAALPMALTGAITTGLTSIFTAVAATAVLSVFDVGGWVLNSLLAPIIGGLEALAPTSPVLARQGSNDMLRIASGAMSSLVGMTITAESLSTFKHFGLGYISAMLFDASGYRTLIGAIVGAHVEHAVKIPLSYYTHDKYRPNVLDPKQAAQSWIRGHITVEAYHQHLAWAGYPDTYFDYFDDVAYSPMSSRLMVQLVRSGLYDDELFTKELRDAGYRPATIEKLRVYLRKVANESVVAGSRALIKKEYKAGAISEADYATWLRRTGMSEELIKLEISVAQLEMQQDARDLSVAGILALYRERIIIGADAATRIAAYGYTESAIRDLLDLEDAKLVTELKRLTQAQAASALELGVINRDDYWGVLVALNYAEWDAMVLLAIEETKLAKKVK